MRLKHLQLQGYKTFATKTEFLFPSGITAIVGPNGSGKSNIADAIRWVLGEQSYTTLRGKRTEDMIFSGSQNRPRAGMAEVILTMDNSENWLPVEFTEVTVSRRAFRDGQNEYRINANRVRLRDVLELLGQSSLSRRNYSIIGQGLVDAVLSLRAQERRELFEEAAGIAHYQDQRSGALRRLEETERNLERVDDIISEIEPRLARLKRQSERAQEHTETSAHLERLLRTWYGYRWGQATSTLERVQRIARQRSDQYERRLAGIQLLTDQIDQVREDQNESRRRLEQWQRDLGALHGQDEGRAREIAVLTERSRQLGAQREENQSELTSLEMQLSSQVERVEHARAELDAAEQSVSVQGKRAQTARAVLEERVEKRRLLQLEQNAARERLAQLRTVVMERKSRLSSLEERTTSTKSQVHENRIELKRLEEQTVLYREKTSQIEASLAQLSAERRATLSARSKQEKRALLLSAQLEREQLRFQEVREEETRVSARFELLSQLRTDLTVYGQATRSLLRSKNAPPGIMGVLAQMIVVPEAGLEAAVEAAMGAFAQAIVVDRWQTAAAALSYLREKDIPGRVLFVAFEQPVTLGSSQQKDGSLALQSLASLIQCDDAIRPVVHRILETAFMIDDLNNALTAFPQLPPGGLFVTRQGEVIWNHGAIAGGRYTEKSNPITQEREWRELETRRVELGAKREALESTTAETLGALKGIQRDLKATAATLDDLNSRHNVARTVKEQMNRQLDRLRQEIEWRSAQIASAESELTGLGAGQRELSAEIAQLVHDQREWLAEEKTAQATLDDLPIDELSDSLTACDVALAAARECREGKAAVLREVRTSQQRLEREIQTRQARIAELAGQEQSVFDALEHVRSDQMTIHKQMETLSTQIEPAQERLVVLEQRQKQLEAHERAERARLREFESHLTTARLNLQRREDELEQLRSRIEDELGLVQFEPDLNLLRQTPLPLHPVVSKLSIVPELPEGLEDEIKRLRAHLRRLGAINPDAPAEYQQEAERFAFLKEQSSDLVAAIDTLHQVIAEMDGLIEHAFRQTFEAVAGEFSRTFSALFGGGQARLELTEPEDLTQTGVEIVAQPPGKRLQALASLSGGERSLTAVALIFAILKVSPTPFCVLDEVDAMLDEANIGRFRSMLEALAEQTQFVIITHNRGTISAADTVYGVSMGSDSVSQVYSIRMHGEKIEAN